MAKKKPSPKIVILGASAGGLKDYKTILAKLSKSNNLFYVLIQHLDPNHKSQLTALLQTDSKLDVETLENGMQPKANTVYVMPSGVVAGWSQGKFTLRKRPAGPKGHYPVDYFLNQVAKDTSLSKIAVILSGTNHDGTAGLRAFKKSGGYIIAQDPRTTEFPIMPQGAIDDGLVDEVLSLPKIAARLNEFQEALFTESSKKMALVDLLLELEKMTGVNFRQYKVATLQRRIQRRMQILKMKTPEEYLKHLKKNPSETKQLFEEVTIHVTSFFRDQAPFAALSRKVFPTLFQGKDSKNALRIWVPGCSTGQEAYTLAILAFEYVEEHKLKVPVQVFATDVSEDSIKLARLGHYSSDVEAELPPKLLKKYFDRTTDGYQVKKLLRNTCVFAMHDLTRDSGFSRMDLVACRNLLIYFNPLFQRKALDTIHYSLKPHGVLMLGQAETLALGGKHFDVIDRKNKIFEKPSVQEKEAKEARVTKHHSSSLPQLPFLSRADHERFLKVARTFSVPGVKKKASSQEQENRRLTEENRKLHAYFLELIENQSALYEELHATHEEVLASNEELQSKNEEYETTQEELQAANEELRSVNDEIIDRNSDLAKLNEEVTASNIQIQETYDYAQAIVDTVREPILILDEYFMVQSLNESFCSTFNTKARETIGKQLFMLGNGQWDIPELRRILRDVLPKRQMLRDYEVEHDFPKIGRRVISLNARQMHLPHSDRRLILLAMEDVTDRIEHRRLLEGERDTSKENVRGLELEKRLREKFVSTLSHDLRSPLTAAKISAQLLGRNTMDPEKIKSLVLRMVNSLDRADGMISDLLDANRITAGEGVVVNLEMCDLSALVRETVEEMSTVHGERFILKCQNGIEEVSNSQAVRRILENLMSNGIKYGDNSQPVTIVFHQVIGGLELTVHNHGQSIPKSDLTKIFRQFSRERTQDGGKIQGWGLGLTLVRGLSQALKGSVGVESSEETGTTFRVFLPPLKLAE
jgi:PAS domain S-box-containing protein